MDEAEGVRKQISISGTSRGLGIRIVGGRTVKVSDKESYFGIFIKEVIKESLAEKDGSLRKGDQLLEVNGTSLVGVSNEKAVDILKASAMTNEITLVISRDSKSQQDFRRLSNSVLKTLDENLPVATSTPRSAQPVVDSGARQNGDHEGRDSNEDEAKRLSTSSELTQVSTTDISSHGDELENEMIDQVALNKNLQRNTRERSENSVALSDVVLEETSVSRDIRKGEMAEASLGFPPPVPTSPPPSLEPEDNAQAKVGKWKSRQATSIPDISRGRSSPEGKAMSPPPSANLSMYAMYTFVIPKSAGLGIIIGGGLGRPDGPHVKIDKVLDGMDAAKDGNLRKGDRIISINGEDFRSVKREKALTILSHIKTSQSASNYNVTIERDPGADKTITGPPTFLPSPQRTTNSSIFNSDTLPATDSPKVQPLQGESFTSDGTSPSKKSTPLRYLAKRDSERRKDKVRHDSMHNRLSMDPSARCKLAKLEWALKYMGYNMTPQQQKQLRSSLDVDESGKVIFIEFVKLAQEMFAFKLEDSHLETNLMLALTHKEDLDMPPMPRKSTSYEHIWDPSLMKESLIKPASSQPILPLAISTNSIQSDEELEQMRRKLHELGYQREKDKILNESARYDLEVERQLTARLKKELKQREEEMRRAKNKSTISEEDEEVLLKRISMTEDAHKAERGKANTLEDEIRKLKAELSVYHDHQPKMTQEELRKRLAVLDNELTKEKTTSRRYQVAVERLMQFVENCHEVLVKSPEVDRIMYHPHGKGASVQRGNVVTGNPRPPQYLSRHAKLTAVTLAKDAQETIAAVRKMMETDVLPFGWQEAYTEDGVKYYINHETQMTSWVHPVTKVAANSSSRSGSQVSIPSMPSGHGPSGHTTPTHRLQ